MQSMKETASNVAASAKAGMEKTKALVQEKAEKMSAHDPVRKEIAAEKKEERMARADLHKHEARQHNAAAKHAREAGMPAQYTTGPNYMTSGTHSHPVTGQSGYPTGTRHVSAVPGHGTGASGLPGGMTGHTASGPGPNVAGYGPGYIAPPGPGTGGTY